MKSENPTIAIRFQLCGWILFIISAIFFIASSIRAGDMLSLAGGLFFLVACLVFMVPLLSNRKIGYRAAKLVTNN